MIRYIALGLRRDKALEIAQLSRHQYYYRPKSGRKGRTPPGFTQKVHDGNGTLVPDSQVLENITRILGDEDTQYGYHKMTKALQLDCFCINHKKVMRLMSENHLLNDKRKGPGRKFVQFRKVIPDGPLSVIEMDIKMVWVEEHRQHAYILTALDTFTRMTLGWVVSYSIKQQMVKSLWTEIINNYLQPYDCLNRAIKIEIRNDNDSRFLARSVQQFFAENHLNQVFTHPYTPQENGHIESFHAILSSHLERRTFYSINELEHDLGIFYYKYCHIRLHSSICFLPPVTFWKCYLANLVNVTIDQKSRRTRFKLLCPHYHLSGDMNLKAVPWHMNSLLDFDFFKWGMPENPESGPYLTFPRPSVNNHPRRSLAMTKL